MEEKTHTQLLETSIQALDELIPLIMHNLRCQAHHTAADGNVLTRGQGHILVKVKKGIRTVAGLAQHSQVSKPTISRMTDLLVERGFLRRERDPNDRRTVLLTITPAGESQMAARRRSAHAWINSSLSTLSIQELTDLIKGMEILKRAFTAESTQRCCKK